MLTSYQLGFSDCMTNQGWSNPYERYSEDFESYNAGWLRAEQEKFETLSDEIGGE